MQIADWTESDLVNNIPNQETDFYEFKSSQTPPTSLKTKMPVAASAFWNSGGGLFIVGVDNSGQIDGGIDSQIGHLSISDWIDQILYQVNPVGPYKVKLIHPENTNSPIQSGKVVLVIGFGESTNPPHMAPDNKYYLRAGAHSVPATHFLVEAIQARRGLQKPLLRGVLRMRANSNIAIELVVIALNDAPAINVELAIDPLPEIFQGAENYFPLEIAIIDRENPFRMDFTYWNDTSVIREKPFNLILNYRDVSGKQYSESVEISIKSLGPVQIGGEEVRNGIKGIKKELERLTKQVRDIGTMFRDYLHESNVEKADKTINDEENTK